MKVFIVAFLTLIWDILVGNKTFLIFLFVITAGHTIEMPEWLSIVLDLICLYAIIIWWFGQKSRQ